MAVREQCFVECINVMISWTALLLMKLTSSGVVASQASKEIQISQNHSRLNLHWNGATTKYNKKLNYCVILNQMQYLWAEETANLTKGKCCRANIWWHINVMASSHTEYTSFFSFHLPNRLFWWSTISYGWRRRVMRWNQNGKGSYYSSEYQQ